MSRSTGYGLATPPFRKVVVIEAMESTKRMLTLACMHRLTTRSQKPPTRRRCIECQAQLDGLIQPPAAERSPIQKF
jgi:uncharacterized protein with PIN domain